MSRRVYSPAKRGVRFCTPRATHFPKDLPHACSRLHPPDRTPATPKPDAVVLPAGLAYQLVHTLQLTTEEIAALTLDEAVQRMAEYWGQPPE